MAGAMTTTWTQLANAHGPAAVIRPGIAQSEVARETERQWMILEPMLRALLTGSEQLALDFGCGAGRFTPYLVGLTHGPVIGYDPCHEMLAYGNVTPHPHVRYTSAIPHGIDFDVIFVAMVLGDPEMDLDATATTIASLLAPGGLLILLDHMPHEQPRGRWWQFRPQSCYRDLFATRNIPLAFVGNLYQLENEVTVLAGRKQ